MCLMDWQLGRLVRRVTHPTSVISFIIPSNPNRIGLMLSGARGDGIINGALLQIGINDSGTTEIVINDNSPPQLFTTYMHGDLPMQKWLCTPSDNSTFWCFTEFLLPNDYLNLSVEELRKKYIQWHPSS